MDKETENKIKLAIINKSQISLLDNITSIDFIHNDDNENYRHTSVNINHEIRETWGAINYGVMDFEDISENEELACTILDFINENIKNEKDKLKDIINDTSTSEELVKINKKINTMKDKLIKEIDKIAKQSQLIC